MTKKCGLSTVVVRGESSQIDDVMYVLDISTLWRKQMHWIERYMTNKNKYFCPHCGTPFNHINPSEHMSGFCINSLSPFLAESELRSFSSSSHHEETIMRFNRERISLPISLPCSGGRQNYGVHHR